MKYSEEEILSLLSKNESRSYGFNLLVLTYQEKVYWVIRRIVIAHEDADDLTQDVFIKAWDAIVNFKGASSIYTWLYRIAVNEALGFLRKKNKRFFLSIGNIENELANLIDDGIHFSGDEVQKKFQKALLKLSERQRVVFNLRYFDELKFSEVSEILKMTEGGVKSTYHQAVEKIKENLALE